MVKNDVKGSICRFAAILILLSLLCPSCVSAECGECDGSCNGDNCNRTQCLNDPKSCDDGRLSWKPYATSANNSPPGRVESFNPIMNASISGGKNVTVSVNCDDGNSCTRDYFGQNGCVHDRLNCDDGNPCTMDYCGANGCVHDRLNCDDGNVCTDDSCNPAIGCVNAANTASCDDGNACTADYCSPNGCVHDTLICDDGNAGIADAYGSCSCENSRPSSDSAYAMPGSNSANAMPSSDSTNAMPGNDSTNAMPGNDSANASAFEPWEPGVSETDIGYSVEYITSNETQSDRENASTEICDDGDPCTIDTNDGRGCIYASRNCDDENDSTLDSCEAGDCVNVPIVISENNSSIEFSNQAFSAGHRHKCNDSNWCTNDTFDGNACVHTPKDCDDNNSITFDYCYGGDCIHILTSCDDGIACTTDSYNGTDCVHTSNCDDKIPCTVDSCDPVTGCKYVPKNSNCNDGNPCTVDTCDSVLGCKHKPVVCGKGKTCINGFCHYPYVYAYPYAYPYTYPYASPYTEPYNYNQPSKSYTIPAGTDITLPYGAVLTALDTLKVENGIAYSSGSPLRFVRELGRNQPVLVDQSSLLISDQAEMIGLSWQTSAFTVVLIQPDGSVLPLKGDDQNVLHLIGSNYDYYFLHKPAKGNWNIEIRPTDPGALGQGFSLITGPVRGAAPLQSA